MPSLAAVASRPIALGFDSSACMATAGQAWGVKAREDNPAPPLSTAGSPMVSHTLNRINDADLIREAQRGSRTAFEELVRQYDQAGLRLAMHLTGSDAEAQDIYQEAFLKAYRHLGNFRFECSFYTWIYRIVTNLCLDHLRKKNSRRRDVHTTTSPDGDQEDVLDRMPDHNPSASPERSFAGRELQHSIVRALGRLSPRERIVFELKHYH